MKGLGIHKSVDLFEESEPLSQADISRVIPFGINFLDKSLKGILPTDLVVIAADSGAGKTELATTIALNAGKEGKRVLFFALEAEQYEIERRIKFKLYSECYHRDNPNPPRIIEFDDWYFNQAPEFLPYKDEVKVSYTNATQNLNVCYKVDEHFGVHEFETKLMALKEHTDIVILDHLHYFDTNEPNEMMAYGRMVKKIRHIALQEKVPIILVCHVRKKERGENPLVPSMEDIFGTSDVFKNATKVIMLAGNPHLTHPYLRETYIHSAKYRFKGGVKSYLGKVLFNTLKNSYERKFQLGYIKHGMREFVPISDELYPQWAR